MSINTPITVMGDVSTDGIKFPTAQTHLEIGSVLELAQVQIEVNTDGDISAYRCVHCGEELNEADPTETLADGVKECDANDDGPHEKQVVPFTWAKNIAIWRSPVCAFGS